tara:strand:+ start:13915 stop:14748 length:834 start_codon:yes stop_codon:yes gene_type:complete
MENRIFKLLIILTSVVLISACSQTTDVADQNTGVGNSAALSVDGGTSVVEYAASPSTRGISFGSYSENAANGIWVSGSGAVTVEPDIAVIRLGVEVIDTKVSTAKSKASNSSNKVLRVVKNNGIADKDVQTSRLSIQPRYEYKPAGRELIGYAVSWDLVITVLDLDKVESIIDDAITAGGEFITISSINFELKDAKQAKSEARAIAVKEAIDHAQEIADAAGVNLGKPFFISESSSSPVYSDYSGMAMASMERSLSIPIESGSLDILVSVQARFLID